MRKEVIDRLGLSPREKEVIEYLSQGLSNHDIATILNVSINTVKFHNHNIFNKLGVDSRVALINKVNDLMLKEFARRLPTGKKEKELAEA